MIVISADIDNAFSSVLQYLFRLLARNPAKNKRTAFGYILWMLSTKLREMIPVERLNDPR